MADQTRIAQWLLGPSNRFTPRIREFSWPQQLGLSLFDFEIEINLRGQTYVGRGTDMKEEVAIAKASSEVIERAFCGQLGLSSEGMAVHFDEKMALENAKFEAMERSILEWHQSTQHSLNEITLEKVESIINWPVGSLANRVRFARLRSPQGTFATLCILEAEDQKRFLGLSLDLNENASLKKSLIEALRNLTAYSNHKDIFLRQIKSDPAFWCVDDSIISSIEALIVNSNPFHGRESIIVESDSKILFFSELTEFSSCPGFIAYGTAKVKT